MRAICKTCDGRRKVLGMGGMKKDCPECGGRGSIDISLLDEEKRKAGRPKKDK